MIRMKPLCTLLMLVASTASAYALDALDPLEQSLIDKASYWSQKGRGDLAAESWNKLLQADPNQPDALTGLGIFEAGQGHAGDAGKYLDALKKSHPGHPGIKKIEAAIQMGKLDKGKANRDLDEARRLAAAHRYAEAVARYKQVFAGTPPQGDLALEYYQTLAGTKNGWEEARQGLAELAQSDPQNAAYALAYARHLSYREGTRREAIAMLSRLAGNPQVALDARNAWRQALIWLTASRADNALYREYLARFSGDNAVKARYDEINRPVPLDAQTRARANAFNELKGGELDTAEAGFERALRKKPSDADALAGLAVIKLRRQEFGPARDLFGKAMRMAPRRRGTWEAGYRTASLWFLMGQAQRSDPKQAESLLRQAVAYDSKEHVARIALANLLAEEGMLHEAESNYRQVLKVSPDNPDALAGLAKVLARQNRGDEAQKLADSLGAGHPLLRAQLAEATGDYTGAQTALENAMLADPANPWIRLKLAEVYRKQGAVAQARSLIDGLLESDPQMPDALYASALLSGESGQWMDALIAMQKIRQEDRTPAMVNSQRRFWIQAQVERAVIYSHQGNGEFALDALKQAESAAGKSTDLLGSVATGYARTGNEGVALSIMRHAISASPYPSMGMKLQYASILLQTRQDVELGPLLNQMSLNADKLGAKERDDLDKLRIGFALRQADLAREEGNLAKAYDFLSPELGLHPDDARLQMALARMYNSAGDYASAYSIYQGVLAREPGNVDAMLSAAGAAIDARDYGAAQQIVNAGLVLDAQNPRLLGLAGKIARIQGKDDAAVRYFKQALALERRQPAGTGGLRLVGPMPIRVVPSLQSAPSANPFSGVRPARFPAFPRPANPGDLKPIPLTSAPAPAFAPAPAYAAVPIPAFAPVPVSVAANRDVPVMQGEVSRQAPESGREAAKQDQSLQQELDDLRTKYSNSVAAGVGIRNRSGEAGMSQLLDIELPVKGVIHTGYSGTLTVSATPVSLSAGDLNMTDPAVARRFGSNTVAAAIPGGSVAQNASGLGLGLAYQAGGFTGDVGITPLSFTKTNFVGGLSVQTKLGDDLSFGAALSRRPVTDSLLSYAGAKDTLTGTTWGGVTSNGLHLDFGYDDQEVGVYLKSGYHHLTGKNVASNNKFDVSTGGYYYAIHDADDILTVGGNITVQAFSKNLSYYSFGQGGYFSPQNYFSVAVPVEWSGRKGKLSYQLQTSLGVQSYREDAAPYFPNDPFAQSVLQALALVVPGTQTYYQGASVTGFGYSLTGGVEYQIAPKVFVGGKVALDNASNYNQQIGLAYLRYSFLPQAGEVVFPPRVVAPYFLEQAP